MKVALHAASGLAFLHSVEPRPVIYRDFKTSNILVDKVGRESGEEGVEGDRDLRTSSILVHKVRRRVRSWGWKGFQMLTGAS